MSGRLRFLLIVAVVVILLGVGAAVLLPSLQGTTPTVDQTGGTDTGFEQPSNNATIAPTYTAQPTIDIVVAIQQIGRGQVINPDMVDLRTWPEEYAPQNVITNLDDVIGNIARTDIYREQPISRLLITPTLNDLGAVGSDAAALLPPGTRMVSVPIDLLTSGAYAIQPGDRVDAIISLLFVDIDREMQTIYPNDRYFVIANVDQETNQVTYEIQGPFNGRGDAETIGSLGMNVLYVPVEDPRPRLTTQMTIQDALVVYTGPFPENGRMFAQGVPTPDAVPAEVQPTPTTDPNQREGTAAPTQPPPRPNVVSLAVLPQDAAILVYHVEARTPITFALRPANETGTVEIQPVTLDFIMQRYNIQVPRRNDFAVEPAIRSIRRLITTDDVLLSNTAGGRVETSGSGQ